MLKYFGLKEILFGIKRFFVVIIVITITFGIIGCLTVSKGADSTSNLFSSSKSYLVTAKPSESEQSQSERDLVTAKTLSAMINADFAKEYVLDELLKVYSVDEIMTYTGVSSSNKELEYVVLNDNIVSAVINETGIINFFVKSYDENFSNKAVGYFEDYLLDIASEQVPQLDKLVFLGGTVVTEETDVETSVLSTAKKTIIFSIIGFVLSLCVVLIFVLFKPTVATKDNFEEYNITILDDFDNHSSSDFSYATEIIKDFVNTNNYSSIAMVSTIKNSLFNKKFDAFISKLQNMDGKKCSFVQVENIITNFESFKVAKTKNAVILVERKGETYHSDISNTISLLEKHNIPIMGVILI